MALSIRDPETDRLARELAALTGETMTQAIKTAIRQRLERARDERSRAAEQRYQGALAVLKEIWALPVEDDRPADEILGYDENGLPT